MPSFKWLGDNELLKYAPFALQEMAAHRNVMFEQLKGVASRGLWDQSSPLVSFDAGA